MIRYDTRCYFNVRSKANMSQLNLYRKEPTTKKCKNRKIKNDSHGSPLDNWKRLPGRPRITWLNTVQRDLRAYNLTLNEAVIDLAQNRPL